MSEMVEHVARALCRKRRPHFTDLQVDHSWQAWADDARAAIEAMRKPTKPVVDQLDDLIDHPAPSAEFAWGKLIDAALK